MNKLNLPIKRNTCILSFSDEDEPLPIKKFLKNPEFSAKSSEESKKIEEIKKNYEKAQHQNNQELIELSFAY